MCLHVSRVFGCSFSVEGVFDGLGLFFVPFQSRARENLGNKKLSQDSDVESVVSDFSDAFSVFG